MRHYSKFLFYLFFVGSGLMAQAADPDLVLEQMYEPAVYAPWRDIYKTKNKKNKKDAAACVFCEYADNPCAEFPVLACYDHCFVVLNIYPYTKGHVLVIPYQHGPSLSELSAEARAELMDVVALWVDNIKEALECPGFNVGVNMGTAAKASIPDHLHIHVMPRYEVDAGFASMIGGVRVVAWDLLDLYQILLAQYQLVEYEQILAMEYNT